ncbi:MAG: TonB-dependent receptor, partial [Chitinophagaceae bacterium]|nr:TonB-dependent receptor [Chitinophagaceae bacterium]
MKLFKIIHGIKCSMLLFGIFYFQKINAQTKQIHDVQIMPLIKIQQTRIQFLTIGNKIIKIDSTQLAQAIHQNLGEVLANESSVFIKNYGPSNLSSSSFRGGNAAQTAVLWNGFQLNNALNGQLDFSLIPSNFNNDISIQYGGSSALWGSGALGGAIILATKPQWEKGFQAKINLSVSSFSTFQQQLSFGWSNKNVSTNLQLLHLTAKNNFNYLSTDKKLNEQLTQTNAEQKTTALKYDLFYSLSARQQIQFSIWKQFNNRNIAPTILQTFSNANQKDDALRISAEWSNQRKKNNDVLRTAFFNEKLYYTSNNIIDTNSVKTWIIETEKKWIFRKRHLINGGINFTQNWANLKSEATQKMQNNISLFASYSINFNKLNTTFSARQQFWNLNKIPFTFSIGTAYSLLKNIELKANFSKVYRLPTLNDLFWNPGGNPN